MYSKSLKLKSKARVKTLQLTRLIWVKNKKKVINRRKVVIKNKVILGYKLLVKKHAALNYKRKKNALL